MTLKQQYAHLPTAQLKALRDDPTLSPYARLLLVEEIFRRKQAEPRGWRWLVWWLKGGDRHERQES